MSFALGDCYRNIRKTSNCPPEHYWFILSDPAIDAEQILCANVTSWNERYGDSACKLRAGDHKLITKESYVNYEDLKQHSLYDLRCFEKSGLILRKHPPADQDLIQLMQRGALDSDFCPIWAKQIIADQDFPDL